MVVFYNALMDRPTKVDYHAVPAAVFTHPEVASVGLREKEAVAMYGEDRVLVGTQKFEDTAKGMAMGAEDYFVKVLVDGKTDAIIGAHIVGPHASVLIQEIINLMYTKDRSWRPMRNGMHIHPALNEVVERAFGGLTSVAMLKGHAHSHGAGGHGGGGGHGGH
jgi:mycothione reductase